MTETKESMRDKLIIAIVQTLIFGMLLAVFGLWLNMQLESYKKGLTDDTERLKAALQSTSPLAQQRYSAYLDIRQAAQKLDDVLVAYYFRAKQPQDDALSSQLSALINTMEGGGSGGSISLVSNEDVLTALDEVVSLKIKYKDISSEVVNSAIDSFLNAVMQDLAKAVEVQNDTVAFHTTARGHLDVGFASLNNIINQALRLDELPIR